MGALVRIVWPTGSARVNWEGAIVSMHESDGHLTVTWRDEDDYEQFDKIADLGWIAVGEEGTRTTRMPIPEVQGC